MGVNFPGIGAFTLNMAGDVSIFRGQGMIVPDHHIDTEMVSMMLTGFFMGAPITLIAGDGVADLMCSAGLRSPLCSLGRITEVPGGPTLADSSFDVFFELSGTPFGPLRNRTSHVDAGRIAFIPPIGYTYQCLPGNCPIPLFDTQGNMVGTVTSVIHIPAPEPHAVFLLGPGLAVFLCWRRTSTARTKGGRAMVGARFSREESIQTGARSLG